MKEEGDEVGKTKKMDEINDCEEKCDDTVIDYPQLSICHDGFHCLKLKIIPK